MRFGVVVPALGVVVNVAKSKYGLGGGFHDGPL
jgi:hypothetical protein